MPNYGDSRTNQQKEKETTDLVRDLLNSEFQSWGQLKKKSVGIVSVATLSKKLKQLVDWGSVERKEEYTKGNMKRTYYCRKASKLLPSKRHNTDFQLTEAEEKAYGQMEVSSAILFGKLLGAIHYASESESLWKAQAKLNSIIEIELKHEIFDVLKLFYNFDRIKYKHGRISGFVFEGSVNDASEKAKVFLETQRNEDLMKELLYAKKWHPYPDIIVAWAVLTSETFKETIIKIENEVTAIQRANNESIKKSKEERKKE